MKFGFTYAILALARISSIYLLPPNMNMDMTIAGPPLVEAGSYYLHPHVYKLCPEVAPALVQAFDIAEDAADVLDLLMNPELEGDERLGFVRDVADTYFIPKSTAPKMGLNRTEQLTEVRLRLRTLSLLRHEVFNHTESNVEIMCDYERIQTIIPNIPADRPNLKAQMISLIGTTNQAIAFHTVDHPLYLHPTPPGPKFSPDKDLWNQTSRERVIDTKKHGIMVFPKLDRNADLVGPFLSATFFPSTPLLSRLNTTTRSLLSLANLPPSTTSFARFEGYYYYPLSLYDRNQVALHHNHQITLLHELLHTRWGYYGRDFWNKGQHGPLAEFAKHYPEWVVEDCETIATFATMASLLAGRWELPRSGMKEILESVSRIVEAGKASGRE